MKSIITIVFTLILLTISLSTVKSQDLKVLEIYDKSGKQVEYSEFIKQIASFNIVLFGEMHNCPATHWMENKVTESLHNIHKNKLVLGAEMFESDNQLILDEHLKGIISEERFEEEMRLWPNYSTDYMALIDLAKEYKLQFAATNIPRRYARVVKKIGLRGLDSLVTEQGKKYIAPLPIPYTEDSETISFFSLMGSMGHNKSNPKLMAQSQAIKDATMAWNIVKYTKEGTHFLHFNGSYHSDTFSGIPTYLKKYAPKLKFVTISSARQDDINALEEVSLNRADFIIVVKSDFPHSY